MSPVVGLEEGEPVAEVVPRSNSHGQGRRAGDGYGVGGWVPGAALFVGPGALEAEGFGFGFGELGGVVGRYGALALGFVVDDGFLWGKEGEHEGGYGLGGVSLGVWSAVGRFRRLRGRWV